MKKYSDRLKNKILKLNADGASVASLAKKYGVHFSLIYEWKKKVNSPVSAPPRKNTLSSHAKGQDFNKDLKKQIAVQEAKLSAMKQALAILEGI